MTFSNMWIISKYWPWMSPMITTGYFTFSRFGSFSVHTTLLIICPLTENVGGSLDQFDDERFLHSAFQVEMVPDHSHVRQPIYSE